MIAATAQTLLVLVVATMAAYALARLTFPGKRIITAVILATLFVPPISLLIPNYVIVSNFGWLDSLSAVIIPGAAGAFGVFLLRQFFSRSRSSWRRRHCSTVPAAGRSSSPSSCRCPDPRWRRWRC